MRKPGAENPPRKSPQGSLIEEPPSRTCARGDLLGESSGAICTPRLLRPNKVLAWRGPWANSTKIQNPRCQLLSRISVTGVGLTSGKWQLVRSCNNGWLAGGDECSKTIVCHDRKMERECVGGFGNNGWPTCKRVRTFKSASRYTGWGALICA